MHRCEIGGVALDGTPTVIFDCQALVSEWSSRTNAERMTEEDELKALKRWLSGFPPEVAEAVHQRKLKVALDKRYTKVLQGPKEDWTRYSIPFIASCLVPLARKELISGYEKAMLNIGINAFVHAAYGDKEMYPQQEDIRMLGGITKKAMHTSGLAVTDYLAKYTIVQPDMDSLFQYDKYRDVNRDILSAGGISGILVNGQAEDGSTFASAQVSMQTANVRIEAARHEIAELMNKVNLCIQEMLMKEHTNNMKTVPVFRFKPLDMTGEKALRETCLSLWEKGVVSTRTMMETQGYNMDREKDRRDIEASEGYDDTFINRQYMTQKPDTDEEPKAGRPKMTDEERHSDPDAARRGAQPKPSNPDQDGGTEDIS